MRAFVMTLLIGLSFSAAAAPNLYVQSEKAKLTAAPSFAAATVVTLAKGDELTVIQQENGWYRVRAGGKSGWISRLLVSPHKPINRITVLSDEKESIKTSARRRASNVTTAGAARGLADDDRHRVNRNETANYQAVQAMEAETVSQKDVKALGKTLDQKDQHENR